MRKVSTESEREEWIGLWESSGESQAEWCKAQGLSLHTFRKWVGAHRKKDTSKDGSKVKFIPLEEEVIEHKPHSFGAHVISPTTDLNPKFTDKIKLNMDLFPDRPNNDLSNLDEIVDALAPTALEYVHNCWSSRNVHSVPKQE